MKIRRVVVAVVVFIFLMVVGALAYVLAASDRAVLNKPAINTPAPDLPAL